jgi:thiol-disulfide isomerase/thioredoxin
MLASHRIAFFSVILAILALFTAQAQVKVELETADEPAAIAWPVTYQDRSGRTLTADTSKNKLTLVHFWATWCLPCIEEMRELDTLSAAYAKNGLQIYPLSMDTGGMKAVKLFFRNNQIIHLPVIFDSGMTMFRNYELRGVPGTIFLDSHGHEIARAVGPLDWKNEENVMFIEKQLGLHRVRKQED